MAFKFVLKQRRCKYYAAAFALPSQYRYQAWNEQQSFVELEVGMGQDFGCAA